MKTPMVRETAKVCLVAGCSFLLTGPMKLFIDHTQEVQNTWAHLWKPKRQSFVFRCNHFKKDITGLLARLVAIQRERKKERAIYYWAQTSTPSSNCIPGASGRTLASIQDGFSPGFATRLWASACFFTWGHFIDLHHFLFFLHEL